MTGTRAVIAATLLALGLAGCSSDDPEPKVAPPSPTAPSTSGTSAPEPPEMPDAAKGEDAAAAEAFVKFFWRTVNYAQQTGDVDGLGGLIRSCPTCEAGIASVSEVYNNGGTITGGDGRLLNLDTHFLKGENKVVVECEIVSTDQEIDMPGTKDDKSYSGGRQPFQFMLTPTDTAWAVVFMGEQ